MRFQRTRGRAEFAVREIDVSQEVGGVRRIQVGGFCRIHGRPAAQRDETVEFSFRGERGGRHEGLVGRFDFDFIVNDVIDTGGFQGVFGNRSRFRMAHLGVHEQGDPFKPHGLGVATQFGKNAGTKLDGGCRDGERIIPIFGRCIIDRLFHCYLSPFLDFPGRVFRSRSLAPKSVALHQQFPIVPDHVGISGLELNNVQKCGPSVAG